MSEETSTVTFISEVEVVGHEPDLTDEEVVRLAFENLGDEEETAILDVMVVRDIDG